MKPREQRTMLDSQPAAQSPGAVLLLQIAELFIKFGGRVKPVAKALNAQGQRTRRGAAWSDTSVARLLSRISQSETVPEALKQRCAALLHQRAGGAAIGRRSSHLLGAVVTCQCGSKMYLASTGAVQRFLCRTCRQRIAREVVERLFCESLSSVKVCGSDGVEISVAQVWESFSDDEQRQFVDIALLRILVAPEQVTVVYAEEAPPRAGSNASESESLPSSIGFRRTKHRATAKGNDLPADTHVDVHGVTRTQPAAPQPKAYRVKHVAQLLNLPKSTIYDLVRTGALPSVRTGGQGGGAVLVPASAVDEFLARKKRRKG